MKGDTIWIAATSVVVCLICLTLGISALDSGGTGPAVPTEAACVAVQWEEMSRSTDMRGYYATVLRARTPGGWLVVLSPGANGTSGVYVPDERHEWAVVAPVWSDQ